MRRILSVCLWCLVAFQSAMASAALTVGFDPTQLSAVAGTTHQLDLWLIYEGPGDPTIGFLSLNIAIDQTNGAVRFFEDASPTNEMNFDVADVLYPGAMDDPTPLSSNDNVFFTVANFGLLDVDVSSFASPVLKTLSLDIPSGVSGDFEIQISGTQFPNEIEALRGTDLVFIPIPSSVTLSVAAVPEPASLSLIVVVIAGGALSWRRKRRRS